MSIRLSTIVLRDWEVPDILLHLPELPGGKARLAGWRALLGSFDVLRREVYALFPILEERQTSVASRLSGGQQ